jgi:predicted esterase YcpF (UPF0227 family)
MNSVIIHIHGFLSSHRAERVKLLEHYISEYGLDMEVISPCLSENPQPALDELESLIQKQVRLGREVFLVGHSMGGYYATYLSCKYQLKAVLINPVVRGYEIMCEFFGEGYNPHTERQYTIAEDDIAFLVSINLEKITYPNLIFVLQEKGDEIVDPQEVIEYFGECRLLLEDGGCHDFEHFDKYVATIVAFFQAGY